MGGENYMRYITAIKLLTSIETSFDGRMKFTYDLINPNKFELKIYNSVTGQLRIISFSLKKGIKRIVEVKFRCQGFRINFPRIKNVEIFTFDIYDFATMIKHGINIHENSSITGLDLDVEF
jgi:hypothetical protein